ncbi:hypothetical protein TrVGV298_012010 [Trichoderma virens]|nr:hypothetical protein TrVGV298_012010 [Trichoderma virens]
MTNVSRPPPRDRSGFKIAIICVLKAEFDAVEGLFDQFWEPDHNYGKAEKDPIVYRTGRIGAHDVVLVFLPGKGNIHSANVASSLRSSFNSIRLCLVVGTCGGSPLTVEDEQEIILGDVIISAGVVYADFGQEFCDELVMDDNLQHSLGRPNLEIRAFLNKLSSMRSNSQLRSDTLAYLSQLLQKKNYETYQYPGADKDKLYEKTYRHQHHIPTQCSICSKIADLRDPVCNHSRALTCDELLCDDNMLVRRKRLHDGDVMSNNSQLHIVEPLIHLGLVASSDQTVRSAILRQKLFNEKGVIAFEMEGAGVWDTFPTIVIKGVCNYADSHKTRGWQKYASATAAACLKALLRQWSVVDQPRIVQSELDVSLKHLQMFRTQNYEDQKFRIPRIPQGAFQAFFSASVVPQLVFIQ